MSDERAQAVPEECGQQLRDQRAAVGGHPERHGHDARPALKVIQAGRVGSQGSHEGHQGKKAHLDRADIHVQSRVKVDLLKDRRWRHCKLRLEQNF